MIRLTVKQGSIVQMLKLDADKVFVGRLETNTVRLDDPSVSRKHCLIRQTSSGTLEVLDLNSRHGTLKNGKSVERAPLEAGDEVGVGDVRILIEDPDEGRRLIPKTPDPRERELTQSPGPPARDGKDLVSDAHRTTFSEALYRQVRRTPWWAASIFVHSVAIYLLFTVPFSPTPKRTPFGSIAGSIEEDLGSENQGKMATGEDFEKELARKPVKAPLPTPEEREPDPGDEKALPEKERPLLPEVGRTALDFPMPDRPVGATAIMEIPDGDFGQDAARKANEEATDLLRRSMRRGGGNSLGLLRKLTVQDILVVQGHYDKVETVLDLLDLKYETATVRRLDRFPLKRRKAVFVNCSNVPPSRLSIERIHKFVRSGGYLITSDWGIENVLRRAFEDYLEPVKRRGRNVITPNQVIRIEASPGNERHFLLTGTALTGGEAKWWLEESSYPFRVLKPGTVKVLIESKDLKKQYGAKPVAVTFVYGKGRVLHMLGHFFQKEGNLKGTFSAQRLIANFLIAAVRGK